MVKLKNLILEGMYDKITGVVIKDVFKDLKRLIPLGIAKKKYKGYTIYKNPKAPNGIDYVFYHETPHINVGDYSDSVSQIDFEVILKFAVTDSVKRGTVFVDAFAMHNHETSVVELNIATNPIDGVKTLSKLQIELRELVRHEIEHLTQRGSNKKFSKHRNFQHINRIAASVIDGSQYKYYMLADEIDANIHGLYARAKTTKKPYQKVVDGFLQALIDDGTVDKKQAKLIYNKMKKRILKIGGIPKLR